MLEEYIFTDADSQNSVKQQGPGQNYYARVAGEHYDTHPSSHLSPSMRGGRGLVLGQRPNGELFNQRNLLEKAYHMEH